ncbi:MAG: VWA domain-containing protein, partial [Dehalococcoidia bacterium]|nr:VWA domain-containing protein [Dehalococcoidia bacterium]
MKTKCSLNVRLAAVLLSFLILAQLIAAACATSPAAPSQPAAPQTATKPQGTTPAAPGVVHAPSAPAPSSPASPQWSAPAGKTRTDNIGLSAGGAKDINNFRENITRDYLPLPTDITYEGLFYDYYFDTGSDRQCDKLYYPSYNCAVTKDPISRKTEYYLSVGLNSGMKQDEFERKLLNLVIVLDISGSMSSPFDEYYYDSAGMRKTLGYSERNMQKIEVAKDAINTILEQLTGNDRLGVVLFNDRSYLLQSMEQVRHMDMEELADSIDEIRANGSTNLSAGIQLATDMVSKYRDADQDIYENRIMFLTDAMPNQGETWESSLLGILKRNAGDRIYTTFIGIGVDFNTELVEYISKVRGSNYYSVHSPGEFAERMDNFDYMVTPLVFNLKMRLDAKGWDIETVYGSPDADMATGDLMKISTLFPSERQDGETRGGLVLLKLKKRSGNDDELRLRVTYEDRCGRADSSESVIFLEKTRPEYFETSGIRKGVLLARYADLMKDWLIDQRGHFSSKDG